MDKKDFEDVLLSFDELAEFQIKGQRGYECDPIDLCKAQCLKLLNFLQDTGYIECSKCLDKEKLYFYHSGNCWLCALRKSLGGSNE